MSERWAMLRWQVVAAALALACRVQPEPEPPQAPALVEPSPAVDQPSDSQATPVDHHFTLATLRRSVDTVVQGERDLEPAPDPPPEVFSKVDYEGPLGNNVAYVTPEKPGARRPAIVWIPGGLSWGIGSWLWEPSPRANDQTAAAFREAGVVLMLPALRGANGNPGHPECFGGEVDDVIAAADYLAERPDIDPDRIYLGGHSTGGTMALLVAESTDRFRAVFAFGPVTHPMTYGPGICLDPGLPDEELQLRSAGFFLSEIVTPTFIIEGSDGNAAVLPMFESLKGEAPVAVLEVPGADHFDVLAPVSALIAERILADTGKAVELSLDRAALLDAMAR